MNHTSQTFILIFFLMTFGIWSSQVMAQTPTPTDAGQQITGDFLNTGTPVAISISAPVSEQSTITLLGPSHQATTDIGQSQPGPQYSVVVGRIRKGMPVVFAYAYAMAASADFTAYKFLMWDGTQFKQILDASSGTEASVPLFEDLDHDGTNELVFENENSKYDNPPSIYKWNSKNQVFEEAASQFPGFWEPKIQAEMTKLREWKYSPNSRGPLVYCPKIAMYLKARGGDKDVQEFVALSDKQLQFLLVDKKNDYLQDRATQMKEMVHSMLSGDGK